MHDVHISRQASSCPLLSLVSLLENLGPHQKRVAHHLEHTMCAREGEEHDEAAVVRHRNLAPVCLRKMRCLPTVRSSDRKADISSLDFESAMPKIGTRYDSHESRVTRQPRRNTFIMHLVQSCKQFAAPSSRNALFNLVLYSSVSVSRNPAYDCCRGRVCLSAPAYNTNATFESHRRGRCNRSVGP